MVEHQFPHHEEPDEDPDRGTQGHSVGALLDDLGHTVSLLVKTDWASEPGVVNHAVVQALAPIRNVLDCVEAENLAAYDASGEWRARGGRSCSARTAYELRLPAGDVRRSLRRGRALRHMPVVADAFASGQISAAHVDRLTRARRDEIAEAFEAAEPQLVRWARELTWKQWERKIARWEQAVDTDHAEATADEQASAREFHASETIGGMGRLDGWLDPLGMAEFSAEFDRIEHDLFEADWAEARARLGDAATKHDLARTAAQRPADALVEMARRSADNPVTGPAPAARFVVNIHTDPATLLDVLAAHTGVDPADLPVTLDADRRFCETDAGTTISPTEMLLAALCGRVRRVVYDPDGRLVDLGRTQRLFTGSLRDAVIARARTCISPDCEHPAADCEVDHRSGWDQGGETKADNGDPACDHHNRFKHRHPDLWRALLDHDRRRRRGTGTPDDRRWTPDRPQAPPAE